MYDNLPNHYTKYIIFYPFITHTWVNYYPCMYNTWVLIHPIITHTRKFCVNNYPYCVWVKIYSIFTCMANYLPTYKIFARYLLVWVNIYPYTHIYTIYTCMGKYCVNIYPYMKFKFFYTWVVNI